MTFLLADDWLILSLIAILWVVISLWLFKYWRAGQGKQVPASNVLANYQVVSWLSLPWLKASLIIGLGLMLSLSALRPVYGLNDTASYTSNLDIALVVDISLSMNVRDLQPDKGRLAVTQDFLETFVRQSPSHRYSLVSFAHKANVDMPLTSDQQSILTAIDTLVGLDPTYAQGSDLKQPLEMARDRLINPDDPQDGDRAKVIILFSDGEGVGPSSENPLEILDDLKAEGIKVFTVGAATAEGGLVRGYEDLPGFEEDYYYYQGKKITSRLDEDTLQTIADRTGGEYFPLTEPNLQPLAAAVGQGQLSLNDDELAKIANETYFYWQVVFLVLLVTLSAKLYFSVKSRYDFEK
jgi:Ca-activated chloride channel homolog